MIFSEVRDKAEFLDGVLILVDKPLEWSSFDVVKRVRSILRRELGFKKIKVGHGGTLDPLATGLLLIGTGKATKLLHGLQDEDKEYLASVVLGATTPSFDLETEVNATYNTEHIDIDLTENKLNSFLGVYDQKPPVFSAKRINGKRAYEYARKGEEVEIKSVKVNIHEIELVNYSFPNIKVRVKCSKGTYIRSLANDVGQRLDSGGYLSGLIRTRSGGHKLEDAISLSDFEARIKELSEEQNNS